MSINSAAHSGLPQANALIQGRRTSLCSVLAPGYLLPRLQRIGRNLTVFLSALLSTFFSASPSAQNPVSQPLVLTHVTIIDMTGAPTQPNMTVVITGNRISALGKDGEISAPRDARVVDGTGKFVIPGLWDMHVHTVYGKVDDTERTLLPLFVLNGITGIRNMGSSHSIGQINRWRARTSAGELLAPRIIVGQQVDGVGGDNVPFVYRVKTATEARAAVQRIKREGFDFVKVYGRLSRETYFAMAEEAKRQDIPFAGHVPPTVSVSEASNAGQRSMEHLYEILTETSSDEVQLREAWLAREVKVIALNGKAKSPELEDQEFKLLAEGMSTYSEEKAARLFTILARNNTYQCPTLVIHRTWGSLAEPAFLDDPRLRYVPVRARQSVNSYLDAARIWSAERKDFVNRVYQTRLRLIGTMHGAGVPLLAGTDTGVGYPVPGFALHDELALFVQAGLTPLEALQTATINPARFLGLTDSLGTIEKGKLADLVLLDANPLDDIRSTKKIAAVIVNGHYLGRETLDRMIADVDAAANRKSGSVSGGHQ